jgi:hypothetical protein
MALSLEQEARLAELQAKAAGTAVSRLTPKQEKRLKELQAKAGRNTAIEYGAAFGADIAVSEGGRLAGAAIGTAIAPGVGTAIGYVVGGLGSGASGSILRQQMLNPDAPISYGQVVADALINLIPGAKGGKSLASAVARQAGAGAGISTGAQVAEKAIDEGRLPTSEELTQAGLTGAALGAGLGLSGEAFSKAYSKYGGMPTRDLSEAYKVGDPDAKILVDGIERTGKEYEDALRDNFKEIRLGISEKYSDSLARAKALQDIVAGGQLQNKNAPLKVSSDEMDFYLQRRLAEEKLSTKQNEVQDLIKLDAGFLASKARELDSEVPILSRAVNEYLYAKHGIAYNKANRAKFGGDGAAGRSTKELEGIVEKFEGSKMDEALKEVIESRRDLSKRILDTIEDGGLISSDDAAKLRKQFPDYVPLNRIMETDELGDVASSVTGRGGRYETLSTGVRRAKGSELEVKAISQNIVENLIQSIRRAEVNKANQAFVKLIRNNPDVAADVAVARKPKVIGSRQVKDVSAEAEALRAAGKKVKSKNVPIYERADRDALTVFENGKPLFVEFKDPKLAAAMKGQNKAAVGAIMKGLLAYNRFVGGLYTRFSPEFAAPNLIRDRSEAFVNNMRVMPFGQALKTLDPFTTIGSDMNTIQRNLRGIKATDERGIELDKIYKEFVDSGGSTGGLGLSTVQDVEENIAKLAKKLDQPTSQKAKTFINLVNGINDVFENATRFATYRRGRASGMTADQAAFAARNSSFDPRLQGSQGDTLRALYLFSNPAIQGAKNFLRSMSNPKVAVSVMTGLTGISLAVDQYNKSIDPDYREKIPEWKLNKHFTFVTGKNADGSLKYVSIPIGYSMVPFKIAADTAQRIIFGDDTVSGAELAQTLAKNTIDSYNPMGGSLTPTILRPIQEIAENKDGLGRDIRPSWMESENISDVEKIHPWTARTQGGELALSIAEQLADMGYEVSPANMLHLYQTYTGGPGKTVERLFDVTSSLWNGKRISTNQVPILRRFYGETYPTAFEFRTNEKQSLDNIEKAENTSRQKVKRITSKYTSQLAKATTNAERRRILDDAKADPEVTESVVRRIDQFIKDDAAGITSFDKRLKGASVMARARTIAERLKEMPREQIPAYLQEMRDKRILTKSVERMILETESLKSAITK